MSKIFWLWLKLGLFLGRSPRCCGGVSGIMGGEFLVFGIPTVFMASFFECLGGLISIFGISETALLVVGFFERLGGLISKEEKKIS